MFSRQQLCPLCWMARRRFSEWREGRRNRSTASPMPMPTFQRKILRSTWTLSFSHRFSSFSVAMMSSEFYPIVTETQYLDLISLSLFDDWLNLVVWLLVSFNRWSCFSIVHSFVIVFIHLTLLLYFLCACLPLSILPFLLSFCKLKESCPRG